MKSIFITGANRGLGYSLANEGLIRGFNIYAGVKSSDSFPMLDPLKNQYPNRVHLIEIDVSDEESVKSAFREVQKTTESLNGIINNAAIMLEREKTIEELEFELVRRSFEINTFGPMRVVKHFLPLIYAANDPVIINISSEAGTIVNAFSTNYPYSMSKTALNMFSERLKHYVQDKGISVYAIHPGWVKTDMGGEEAPGEPSVSAAGIFNIIEKKLAITSKIAFINHLGKPMPL
ncbi:SDR family oxidoreductase [Paenibacillus agricola]|uniref:SDR family oxidoreductase n=1 Tax=Paenibacillus agricola TaxID=2716264 RepID=A0ABX0J9F8_9BACL|nr:SDR family oxidoreductase [Paenibacillus agricola]NHN31497.1 SDR family oxidoreductase [Paenibacillus agricola]